MDLTPMLRPESPSGADVLDEPMVVRAVVTTVVPVEHSRKRPALT